MWRAAMHQPQQIRKITHHFFDRGHSQSEGDSVHARIENETKLKEIYTPNEWMMFVQNAKLTDPRYTVEELHTEEVMDFKKLVEDVMINYEKQNDGQHNITLEIPTEKNKSKDGKGRSVPKKQVKFISCKCKYKCRCRFSVASQLPVFQQYWKTGS